MHDLSSWTRDRTLTPCNESAVLTTGPPGKFQISFLKEWFVWKAEDNSDSIFQWLEGCSGCTSSVCTLRSHSPSSLLPASFALSKQGPASPLGSAATLHRLLARRECARHHPPATAIHHPMLTECQPGAMLGPQLSLKHSILLSQETGLENTCSGEEMPSSAACSYVTSPWALPDSVTLKPPFLFLPGVYHSLGLYSLPLFFKRGGHVNRLAPLDSLAPRTTPGRDQCSVKPVDRMFICYLNRMRVYVSIRRPGRARLHSGSAGITNLPLHITHVLFVDLFLDPCFVSAWETHLTTANLLWSQQCIECSLPILGG